MKRPFIGEVPRDFLGGVEEVMKNFTNEFVLNYGPPVELLYKNGSACSSKFF